MMETILIVDDEEGIRFGFSTHLAKQGYKVVVAENYDTALVTIQAHSLDLIISDIILDAHTGIDILKQVSKLGIACPVIMVTGQPNLQTATEAVRLGAFDYLPKPVRKETLLNACRLALRHKALEDEKKRAEAENTVYRNNLEAIFSSIQDGIITVEKDLTIIEANAGVAAICDLVPEIITGKQMTRRLNTCTMACLDTLSTTLESGTPVKEVSIRCCHEKRPGQTVLLNASPLVYNDGKLRGAVLVIKDITRLSCLEKEVKQQFGFHQLIGKSQKMRDVYRLLQSLSDTDTTVLITGESGTGKELTAKALHYSGERADKPLVTVNCSALSENLLESELFGHVRGAFTGAVKEKTGRFQLADTGTLFLDEIGDISPMVQLKLLRVLQEREFEKIGGTRSIKVDVRIVAATNQDLRAKILQGRFRKDLYYRLNVIEIKLPPLRERLEDIPLLSDHFFNRFKHHFNRTIDNISDEVMDLFMYHSWPGNVRELEHAIEHAFVLCHGRYILKNHLPNELLSPSPATAPHGFDLERSRIINALGKTGWNKARAARLLGISRQGIYRKIARYGIAPPPS
ncbi:MAG: sigma 54-interacting transcriptional regulator [Desulfobacterium sp.]|nr:sigma 54-interacting transcriptional regulator [Desulfobacterium sp.]